MSLKTADNAKNLDLVIAKVLEHVMSTFFEDYWQGRKVCVTLETEVKAFEAGDDSRVDSPTELLIPKSIIPEPLILEPVIPEHVSTCTWTSIKHAPVRGSGMSSLVPLEIRN